MQAVEELTNWNFISLLPPPFFAVRKILERIPLVIKCRGVQKASAHHSLWECLPVWIQGWYFLPLPKKSIRVLKSTASDFGFGFFSRNGMRKTITNDKQNSMKNCCVGAKREHWTLTGTNTGYFGVVQTMTWFSFALFGCLLCFLGCIATWFWERQ